jgi:hypothetical protein
MSFGWFRSCWRALLKCADSPCEKSQSTKFDRETRRRNSSGMNECKLMYRSARDNPDPDGGGAAFQDGTSDQSYRRSSASAQRLRRDKQTRRYRVEMATAKPMEPMRWERRSRRDDQERGGVADLASRTFGAEGGGSSLMQDRDGHATPLKPATSRRGSGVGGR